MVVRMVTSSIEYPSSALRYALLTVKPVPHEEFVKIRGIRTKFRRRGIRYEPEKQFVGYEDFISFRYDQILSRMPLPEPFTLDKVLAYFVDDAVKRFNEDKELLEELENKQKSLLGFVEFIQKRFESKLSEYYELEANRFLYSNLPLSFFSQTSMFLNTYQKYLRLVRRIVRRYEVLSSLGGIRDRQRARENQLNRMKYVMSPLIDRMDLCSIALHALKLYICLWSAQSFEEINNPRFLDIKRLDQNYLGEYTTDYMTELKSMRRMIHDLSKEFEPEIFDKEITSSNSETMLLSKLLSSDLG
jgi:hypothetical protein